MYEIYFRVDFRMGNNELKYLLSGRSCHGSQLLRKSYND